MLTIVELPEYQRRIKTLLTPEENIGLINHLASTPEGGVLLQGAGGIRKLRWAAKGKGKSGGVRVIYYFYNRTMPLFLLTVFGKSEKANITQAEAHELAELASLLKQHYGASR